MSIASSTGPILKGPAIAPILSNTLSALPTVGQPPLPILQEIIEESPCFVLRVSVYLKVFRI